jgi:hypothetical protein
LGHAATDAKHLVSSVARFVARGAGLAGFVPLPLLDSGLQPNGNELGISYLGAEFETARELHWAAPQRSSHA